MKNNLKNIIALILVLVNCLMTFTACAIIQKPNEEVSDNRILASKATIKERNKVVPASQIEGGKLFDSFRDDQYYYYVYYMGYISNVPLQNDYPTYRFDGLEYSVSLTTNETTIESVSKQVENIVSTNSEWSASSKLGISMEAGGGCIFADAKMGVSVENGFSFGMSKIETTSTIAENVKTYSKEHQQTVNFYFDKDSAHGLYRYVLLGTFDVYAVIAYDTVSQKFYGETFSTLVNNNFSLDYTSSERFNDNSIDAFPDDFLPTLDPNNLVVPNKVITNTPEENIPVISNNPFTLPLNSQNCNIDNNFNVNSPSTDSEVLKHRNYVLGDYTVYGISKKDGGYIVNPEAGILSIHFNLKVNPDALDGSNVRVERDEASKVIGTNITEQTYQGAFWARITFKDGSSQMQIKKVDVLGGAKEGDIIPLLSADELANKVTDLSQIQKIEISFVYEISQYLGKNFWGSKQYRYSNWRSDYTFNFVE